MKNSNVAASSVVILPSNDKFNGTKKSIVNSMNLIERQKIKAMRVVEKMH